MLSCNDLTGNSQYGQQQDAYQGPPQQQGYPPQQQQYPGQQGYPGQQQGYGKNLRTQTAVTERTERDLCCVLLHPCLTVSRGQAWAEQLCACNFTELRQENVEGSVFEELDLFRIRQSRRVW